MDDRPLDRALFAAFAEQVRAGGNGPVADVGCGPGRVTILLSRLGLDAWYRQQPDDVTNLLREAGFEIWATAVREREGTEKTAQGYILARKPSAKSVAL